MSLHHPQETSATTPKALPTYLAEDLTKGADQAQIILHDQVYILRVTRAGKLILTK
jgi:hemin uptake protein HemP